MFYIWKTFIEYCVLYPASAMWVDIIFGVVIAAFILTKIISGVPNKREGLHQEDGKLPDWYQKLQRL